LYPTAPLIQKKRNPDLPHEPYTIGGGKYMLQPDDHFMILLGRSQRDASAYGADSLEFKPERMLDEEFEKLPPGVWRPFGNGVRGCIGRGFAWQEALLIVAMILQNFDVRMDDPSYQLHIKQTLTVKPKDFYIKATLRQGITSTELDKSIHSGGQRMSTHTLTPSHDTSSDAGKPMSIFYGSNTGTCQALAQRLATEAAGFGFHPAIEDMDTASGKLPTKGPVVIITASYEGQPPDNAARFIAWLEKCNGDEVKGVEYAVFGCGHSEYSDNVMKHN
jgi:cytochrome P450 / NADPH-cytochrome P450 reductase